MNSPHSGETGDLEAMTALYWKSPEVVSSPPGELVARGHDAIRAGFEKEFTAKGAKLEVTESHHVVLGDAVLGWGLWKWMGPGPDGKIIEATGRYTDVKAERDGKWVYILDHASSPMMMPEGVE